MAKTESKTEYWHLGLPELEEPYRYRSYLASIISRWYATQVPTLTITRDGQCSAVYPDEPGDFAEVREEIARIDRQIAEFVMKRKQELERDRLRERERWLMEMDRGEVS